VPTVVGDAREDGGHDQPHVESGRGELGDRAQAHSRHRRAGLERPDQLHVHGDQRDEDLDVVVLGELAEDVRVAGDERALGDDADR